MLLTIKCDMLELVWAESKDKEISCKLLNCIKGYFISKAKCPAMAKMETHLLSCSVILGEIPLELQGHKPL